MKKLAKNLNKLIYTSNESGARTSGGFKNSQKTKLSALQKIALKTSKNSEALSNLASFTNAYTSSLVDKPTKFPPSAKSSTLQKMPTFSGKEGRIKIEMDDAKDIRAHSNCRGDLKIPKQKILLLNFENSLQDPEFEPSRSVFTGKQSHRNR